MTNRQSEKMTRLEAIFAGAGSAAVAFSGGVDSAFLLAAAHRVLGGKVLALTARSLSFPDRELEEAEAFCRERGIRQVILDFDVFSVKGFEENPRNRCYLCKKSLFSMFLSYAQSEGLALVAEGSNVDDEGDYRPGIIAVAELRIRSPLREAGFTKQEIRSISKEMGLPTWQKPSYACLASRFVYGERIDPKGLRMVQEAEQYLLDLGFPQLRVRVHGGTCARIEVPPDDLERLFSLRKEVFAALRSFGFTYVAVDLGGYRTGSMNETIFKENEEQRR